MKRAPVVIALVLAIAAIAGVLLAGSRIDAAGSALGRGPLGWSATRAYLERRGTPTSLVVRPWEEEREDEPTTGPGTLVLVFPWQSRLLDVDRDALLRHLDDGGDLLLAYSAGVAPTSSESEVLDGLGIDVASLGARPLAPLAWRRAARREWRLVPTGAWSGAPREDYALRLRAPRWLPALQRDRALLAGAHGRVVAAAWRLRAGRIVVLPAELLANARLASPGHAALLESLRGWLRGPWRFDELHHGLGEPTASGDARAGRGLDLVLLQLLLVYAVAAVSLARRFGPAWRETTPLRGSAAAFLLRLGSLHDRLRHHEAGSELLLRRAAELDRRFTPTPELVRLARRDDAAAFVAVAQEVARRQRGAR